MPIYEYETIPVNPTDQALRFEILQAMADAPLTRHPETGTPVRKVYAPFAVTGSTQGRHAHTSPSPGHPGGCGCCGGGSCPME